jgi:DNA-binding winged helix-turn-helix (wHTH) protein/tetratricopeptide (TPR) repeat protein
MSHVVFQFGEYVIDPAARELWQARQRIALPPKSFECLAYLLEHRQRAVGRDELISAVWGRIDVSDAVLAQTLLRARRAVGDTGAEQTTIRTVPRFGYRWIAAVQSIESPDAGEKRTAKLDGPAPAAAADAHAPEAAEASAVIAEAAANEPVLPATSAAPVAQAVATDAAPDNAGPRRRTALWLAAAAVAIVAIALFALRPRAVREDAATAGTAVAVLPVAVGAAEPESSWIRLGGMDYVAAQLREGGKLAVLPSDQIVTLVGDRSGEEALQRVAKATAAKWLIEPHAEHTAKGWQMQLIAHGNGVTREATATAATPLEAAEQASDHLLSALDIAHAGRKSGGAAPNALTELVQRVDASLLAGDLKEARNLIDAAPPEQRADPALRVREGQLEFRTGHLDEAERLFAPIAASTTPLPVEVQSQAMMGLGAVAVRRQDYPLAEKRYAEALAALGDHGDPLLVGNAYNGRGVARSAQHQFDLAFADLGRARVALERAGNQLDAAAAGLNIGITENTRHRFAQAIPHFDDAIAVHERFGVKDDLAADLIGKAHSQRELLDVAGALASSTRAYELTADIENQILVGSVDLTQARMLTIVGRLREADAVLAKLPAGDVLASEDGDATLLRAEVALQSGDSRKAFEALRAPITTAPDEHLAWLPTFVAAALLEKQGDLARQILERINKEPAEADDRLNLELARARLAAGLNEVADAEKHYVAAVALADQDGVPAERARVGSDYARFLIAQQQLDKASAVVGDLAPYADKDYAVAEVTVALYHALGDTSLETAARNRAKPIAGERVL